MKRSKTLLAGIALFALVAVSAAEVEAGWGWRHQRSSRTYHSYTPISYGRPYNSPGYEYRYQRSTTRTAAGYAHAFGI